MNINILIYGPGDGTKKLKVSTRNYFRLWCGKMKAVDLLLEKINLKDAFVIYVVVFAWYQLHTVAINVR